MPGHFSKTKTLAVKLKIYLKSDIKVFYYFPTYKVIRNVFEKRVVVSVKAYFDCRISNLSKISKGLNEVFFCIFAVTLAGIWACYKIINTAQPIFQRRIKVVSAL